MVSVGPAIEFVLYSEDRADADADFALLREVLLGMLRLVCPAVKTNHVRISPVQPVRKDRICGAYWKDRESARAGAQEHRRALIKAVATELRLGRVVFFHVDADAVYRDRERCAHMCEQWPRFRRDVGSVLARPGAATFEMDEALILAMPFFEMESWAFANVDYLRGVLAREHELTTLSRWAEDLGELDEIEDIKDLLTLSPGHKQALVQGRHGFPAQRLVDAGKSYARTVERLRDSPVVERGLAEAAARAY